LQEKLTFPMSGFSKIRPMILTGIGISLIIVSTVSACSNPQPPAATSSTGTPSPSPATPTATTPPNQTPSATPVYAVIDKVAVSEVTATTATITWETDVPSSGKVDYWVTGTTSKSSKSENSTGIRHSIKLTSLRAESPYTFTVKAKSLSGDETAFKTDGTFTTLVLVAQIGPAIGYKAPDFSLNDTTGKKVNLVDYKGKWLVVIFWETTCSYCRATMPYLQTFYSTAPTDKIAVTSINVENESPDLRDSFLQKWSLTFPVLDDADGKISEAYKIGQYPTTFFIDPNGIIQKVHESKFDSADAISKIMNDLLAQ
jgi:cytochrome c biogenesis protein CcmG, thiol:disulfide interchange protein DsbE